MRGNSKVVYPTVTDNSLLKQCKAQRLTVRFYRRNDHIFSKTVTVKKTPGKEVMRLDFVVKAWKSQGHKLPKDPSRSFVFRHHLPNEQPVGILAVTFVGTYPR